VRAVDGTLTTSPINLGKYSLRSAKYSSSKATHADSEQDTHSELNSEAQNASDSLSEQVPNVDNNRMWPGPSQEQVDPLPPGDEPMVDVDEVNPSSLETETDHLLSNYDRLITQLFDRIQDGLLTDPETKTSEQRSHWGLTESNGLLWRQHRLYIPDKDSLRSDLLYWHHDVPWCAHLGIAKTVDMVKRQFYWPRMDKDIELHVSSCRECQSNKTDRRTKTPPLCPLLPPSTCWRTLGVDLIAQLPQTASGEYDAICVFVCHLSKMVRLVPTTSSLETEGFAKLFFKEVFAHYGFPSRIISDRGTHWNSAFFAALCRRAGILMHLSTAFHP
jgi:hypothetical protein